MKDLRMNKRIVEIASKEAAKSTFRYRVGAVIHKKGRVVAVGFNDGECTHPMGQIGSFNTCKHAEISALLRAKRADLSRCEITVVRLIKSGELAMAKPCRKCTLELMKKRVKRIHFSNEDGNVVTLLLVGDKYE